MNLLGFGSEEVSGLLQWPASVAMSWAQPWVLGSGQASQWVGRITPHPTHHSFALASPPYHVPPNLGISGSGVYDSVSNMTAKHP